MKILFLVDDFPPDTQTSSGILTLNLALALAQRGHELSVITTVREKHLAGDGVYQGIRLYKIYAGYNERWRAYLSLYNPQTVSRVRALLREVRPDICHFQHVHSYVSYYCLKVARQYAGAVFLTVHDAMLFHYGKLMPRRGDCFYRVSVEDKIRLAKLRYNPFRDMVIRHYIKNCHKLFSVSNALQKLMELNGIKNIQTVYNGIDVSAWQERPVFLNEFKKRFSITGKKVVLFCGRLSRAKGGDAVVKALSLIAGHVPEIALMVAGAEDSYTQQLSVLAEKLQIQNKIVFTGWLDREEIAAAYHAADVVVIPSLCFDSFPTVNLEAMAAKKPVVATLFGGSREIIIDNETGYIVDPFDVHTLSEKIRDLLEHPAKAERFGLSGYDRVKEHFSLDAQVDTTLWWYGQAVAIR